MSKEPDNMPTSLQFIKRIAPLSETFTLKGVIKMMESYAQLREQRAVEVERNNHEALIKKIMQIEEFVMMRITSEQSPLKIKNKLIEILNNGK